MLELQDHSNNLFEIEWQDALDLNFNDEENAVAFSKTDSVKFVAKECYEEFKQICKQNAPDDNRFHDFEGQIVARPSIIELEKPAEKTFMLFEVFMNKSKYIHRDKFLKHALSIELQ